MMGFRHTFDVEMNKQLSLGVGSWWYIKLKIRIDLAIG